MRRTGFKYFSILIWVNDFGFFFIVFQNTSSFFFNAAPKVQPHCSGQVRIRMFLHL